MQGGVNPLLQPTADRPPPPPPFGHVQIREMRKELRILETDERRKRAEEEVRKREEERRQRVRCVYSRELNFCPRVSCMQSLHLLCSS